MTRPNEVRVSIKMHLIRDEDIVKLLEKQPNKQGYIKTVLRKEVKNAGTN